MVRIGPGAYIGSVSTYSHVRWSNRASCNDAGQMSVGPLGSNYYLLQGGQHFLLQGDLLSTAWYSNAREAWNTTISIRQGAPASLVRRRRSSVSAGRLGRRHALSRVTAGAPLQRPYPPVTDHAHPPSQAGAAKNPPLPSRRRYTPNTPPACHKSAPQNIRQEVAPATRRLSAPPPSHKPGPHKHPPIRSRPVAGPRGGAAQGRRSISWAGVELSVLEGRSAESRRPPPPGMAGIGAAKQGRSLLRACQWAVCVCARACAWEGRAFRRLPGPARPAETGGVEVKGGAGRPSGAHALAKRK